MKNKRIGIIIQARIGSTRLPKKIILPVEEGTGTTFLDVLLQKIKKRFINIPIILATSKNNENNELEKYATKHNIYLFRGEEENVLKRFVDCANEYKLTTIVRVCSDNPFLDIDLLETLINDYNDEDYFSYSIKSIPSIMTHYGFFAEIVNLKSLEEVLEKGDKECFEHVTNCIYNNREVFTVRFKEIKIQDKFIRCTLDTAEDFENLKGIYTNWYKKSISKNTDSLLSYISSNRKLKESMKQQVLNNLK